MHIIACYITCYTKHIGTGFSRRDVTPEAIKPLLQREAPGLIHAVYQAGLQHTQFAVLSRPVAGTIGNTLVLTLPGSVKAVNENMTAVIPLLPRIVNLLQGHEC
jgi:gephyrin